MKLYISVDPLEGIWWVFIVIWTIPKLDISKNYNSHVIVYICNKTYWHIAMCCDVQNDLFPFLEHVVSISTYMSAFILHGLVTVLRILMLATHGLMARRWVSKMCVCVCLCVCVCVWVNEGSQLGCGNQREDAEWPQKHLPPIDNALISGDGKKKSLSFPRCTARNVLEWQCLRALRGDDSLRNEPPARRTIGLVRSTLNHHRR